MEERNLRENLARIDGKGYKAYKRIAGSYRFERFELFIDHVQGDPFAAPSKIRVRAAQDVARIPRDLFRNEIRRLGACGFLARSVRDAIDRIAGGRRGTGKSGLIAIDDGGQEVLERTAVVLNDRWVEARMQVGLPAAGRTILGREAEELLCGELPAIVRSGLLWDNADREGAHRFVDTVENYHAIRGALDENGLAAFVADGSILPRRSGASDRPLDRDRAVPFRSCPELRLEIPVPNPVAGVCDDGRIIGMGIPKGVTLIVGGGYHGKSTLLRALERGVYPHVPGDGREFVATDPTAVKIRAEDGRSVQGVDISPFISDLPHGRRTDDFVSEDASGSTSQAANIIEAVEIGSKLLLLDEDTSATNFMVRDSRMQALVHKGNEPITPYLDRVRELYEQCGVSTILVMGGCGDYFDVADHVVMMREYEPYDATAEAAAVAAAQPSARRRENTARLSVTGRRVPLPESFDPSRGRRKVKIDAHGVDEIRFGWHRIDLRAVEQLVDPSQTAAVGRAVYLALTRFMDGDISLREVVDALDSFFDANGLDPLDPFHEPEEHPGNFARPRRFEIAAAVNRLRCLRVKHR